jgi:WD40 repeat protein
MPLRSLILLLGRTKILMGTPEVAMKRYALYPLASALTVLLAGCPGAPTPDKGGTPATPSVVSPKLSLDSDVEGHVNAVAVSDDGKVVAVQGYGDEKNVKVWDLPEKKKLQEFDNRAGGVLPVALSPDGKVVAFPEYGWNAVVFRREVASGKELPQLRPKSSGFPAGLFFSPKGDLLVFGQGSHVVGWDPTGGEERFDWTADEKEVTRLSPFFEGGKRIATGSNSGVIKIWDVATGKPIQTLSGGHTREVKVLCATEDGKTLASQEEGGPIQVWDVASGKVVKSIPRPDYIVEALRFLPDGKTLVYPAEQGDIFLEDVEKGVRTHQLTGHKGQVWALAITPDGSTLVSGGNDGTIKVWDLKSLP